MDRIVMQKLEIKNGTHRTAESLFALANARLSSTSEVKDVCGQCEWRGKCLWYGRIMKTGKNS
jgi:hypothetical protein